MKHGKKPTVAQRELLQRDGMDWRVWLVVVNLPNMLVVRSRTSGEIRILEKNGQ